MVPLVKVEVGAPLHLHSCYATGAMMGGGGLQVLP